MVDALENDYVNSEIVCTLAALGYAEDNDYYKGDDCLGKDFRFSCPYLANTKTIESTFP